MRMPAEQNRRINVRRYTDFTEVVDIKRLNYIAGIIQSQCPAGAKILDVGCGNGNIARGIASLGYDVTGIDMSYDAIAYAKSRIQLPNLRFIVCPAERLPVNESYDAVICSEVLEHLHMPEVLLKTLSGIMKPGAVLIATVPNGIGPRELLVTRPVQSISNTFLGKVINRSKRILGYSNSTVQSSSGDLNHVKFFTKPQFVSMIRSNGFRMISFTHSNSVEKVFPFSLITRHLRPISVLDNRIADYLPWQLASGFNTAWIKY